MKKILFFVFALVAIIACEEKEPTNILSKGKMEDVLYDYHIAQAMIEELPYDDREKMAQAYIDAVFRKYDITEVEFDSSLIYYNRHADQLNDIYTSLKERLDEENEQLALSTGNDVMTVTSQNGDTANIWTGSRLALLRCKEGLNYESFTINADSSFHRKDKYILVCSTNIISENGNNPENYINEGLTITYKDGSTTASTIRTTTSRDMQLTLEAEENKDIAMVSGFFYYNGDRELRNLGIVSNIGLVRMHAEIEKPKTTDADSTKLDSLAPGFQAPQHQERLTPEQLREQNQTGKHITIKDAPDVRTPNSTFRRRRPVRR